MLIPNLNQIKIFINQLNIIISTSFFGSQSRFTEIIKDRFMCLFRKEIISKEFIIKKGRLHKINLNSAQYKIRLNTKLLSARGKNNGKSFSSAYTLNEIPEIFKEIIHKNIDSIISYIGKDFLHEPVLVFRTKKIPKEFSTYDIYSNVWHQDSSEGERLIKIFVNLQNISSNDGPLIWLNREATSKYWKQLYQRYEFNKFKEIKNFPEQESATGKHGSYLIINTATCMHRASIPNKYRDMMQLELLPNWRHGKSRKVYDF